MSRLRDSRIRSKLGVILVIPGLAVVALAMIRLVDAGQSALDAGQLRALAVTSSRASALVHELQKERTAASGYLRAADAARDRTPLVAQVDETQKRARDYAERRNLLRDLPNSLDGLLSRVDTSLDGMQDLRGEIYADEGITVSDASFQYTILIADLNEFRRAVSQVSTDAALADQIRAVAALSRAKDAASVEQITVLSAIAAQGLLPAQERTLIATLELQADGLRQFAQFANPEQRELLDRTVAGPEVRDAARYEAEVLATPRGQPINVPADEWNRVMNERVNRLRAVESQLDADVIQVAAGVRDEVVQQVFTESGVVLLLLLIAILVTLLVARQMARSLRQLREGALAVAYQSLPESVARLRDPAMLGELTPDDVAAQVRDPVQVRSRDEIGQVAQAFNVVHREAVRVAAEQAALRSSVSTMFINLARRSQLLVDRLIGHLDRLERGEEDPDRLAELFKLDHLATRMRRNDENLLVLAGADSTRVQRETAALSDVLRAAQSEVEQYTRIEFGIVDRDVECAAHAVNDVVHLLAELFDNATGFSPPDSTVVVDARRVGDRAIVQIEDRGLGVSPEQLGELNERLAHPPLVDVAVSRMMGLVVVARLAARHRIRVELRSAPERGTIADVVLPSTVLVMAPRWGRQHALGPTAPLALESAPAQAGPPPSESYPPFAPPARHDLGAAAAGVRGGSPNGAMTGLPRRQPGARDIEGEVAGRPGGPPVGPPHGPGVPPGQGMPPGVPPGYGRQSIPEAPVPPRGAPVGPPGNPADIWSLGRTGGLPGPRPGEPPYGAGPPPPRPPAPPMPVRTDGSDGLIPRSVDDTMELPIFREVESAWFRTRRGRPAGAMPADRPAAGPPTGPPVGPGEGSMPPPPARAGKPDRGRPGAPDAQPGPVPQPAGQRPMPPREEWQTAADDGWRAATAASQPVAAGQTKAGLPKRVPMAQLVPGGVNTGENQPRPRTPDAVRGLLSAYHRGVQRGRGGNQTSDESGPEGPSGAGKEREA